MEDTVTNNTPKIQNNINQRPETSKSSFTYTRNIKNSQKNTSDKISESIKENSISSKSEKRNQPINDFSFDSLNNKLQNLKNINLIEKDINNLYKWEHLFNNFRPINSYTTISNNKDNEENEENKNEEFKSPILLVDLPEEQMNLFFGRNSNYESSRNKKINNENMRHSLNNKGKISNYNTSKTKNNISHNIRPMSMYSPRINNSCYYYSSVFSDYYKEDFKSFCNKMPILKAKLKIYPEKLKGEIIKHDKNVLKKERLLNQIISKENLFISKQDLIIAAERRNPIPLLKSIFKQNYPGMQTIKENPKLYFNTMKPYGNDNGDVDYFQNDRWKLSNEIIKMRNNNKNFLKQNNNNINNNSYKKERQLFLSYYDSNDPYIVLFNKKVEKNRNINKVIFNKDIKQNQNKTNEINKENIAKDNINNIKNKNDMKIDIKNDILDNKEFDSNKSLSDEIQIFLKSKLNLENSEKVDISSKKEKIENETKKDNKPININNNIKNEKNNNIKIYSRTLNNLGVKDDNLYNSYSRSNCFPLKTSSDVGNTSYNKINKMLHEKKLLNKLKLDYSLTQSKSYKKTFTNGPNKLNMQTNTNSFTNRNKFIDNKKEIFLMFQRKKIKPKKNFSLYEAATTETKNSSLNLYQKNYNYKHWDKGGNLINDKSHKVNYLCFNNYINTVFNKDMIYFKKNEENQYFYPMNAYNKLAGKYYRYNDENNKDKNNNSKNIIHNLFDYSRDEPENDNEITKTEHKKENEEIYNQFNISSEKQ